MLKRQLALQGLALLAVLTACAVRHPGPAPAATAAACTAVTGDTLQSCLDQVPSGGRLALASGRYVITRPLVLHRPIILTTAGAPNCIAGGCAVLALRMAAPGGSADRAITVAGAGSVLDHIAIEGGKADPARDDSRACAGSGRPSMGGLAITAPNVTVRDSLITGVACYTAVQVDAGAGGLHFTGNTVQGNGTHDRRAMWADGLTVIEGAGDVIRGNLFRDNTDVQLVLGGCQRCSVADNRIETTGAPGAASFAGLLVHAWPLTSGDYTGTIITGNTIDCGPSRACGFGLGVGGRAWYKSPTSGGLITGNSITRAQVGINVDDATGPVTMQDNGVTLSGGPVRSRCGLWFAGPVNISERSRPYVDATAGVSMPAEGVTDRSFAGCLPGL